MTSARAAAALRCWSIASRAVAAIVGGYALVSLINIALPLGLAKIGIEPAQTLFATAMVGFLVYAAIIMAVFHARTSTRAWAAIAVASVPLAVAFVLLLPRGG
jgi:hypothetical protein